MQKAKTVLTQSSINRFLGCHLSYYYRMKKGLVAIKRDENMYLGNVVHNCLEWSYNVLKGTGSFPEFDEVQKIIDNAYPNRLEDRTNRKSWHQASAMLKVYMEVYHSDQQLVTVLCQEREFEGEIINPATGRFSRIFKFAGKIDYAHIIRGMGVIGERKTTSLFSSERLQSLWSQLQTELYHLYNPVIDGHKMRGVVYDFLIKHSLKQSEGETEAEYEERRQVAITKSVHGKTNIKQKIDEDDESFQARLLHKIATSESFHREFIMTTKTRQKALMAQLWQIAYLIRSVENRGVYVKNPNNCFFYNKACAYLPLCSGTVTEHLINTLYEYKKPHSELTIV